MSSLTIFLMNKLNVWFLNVNLQNEHCNTSPNKQAFIKLFRKQIYYNYKWDESILKTWIQRNVLPTYPNKR